MSWTSFLGFLASFLWLRFYGFVSLASLFVALPSSIEASAFGRKNSNFSESQMAETLTLQGLRAK
jgi:hypothetical protein